MSDRLNPATAELVRQVGQVVAARRAKIPPFGGQASTAARDAERIEAYERRLEESLDRLEAAWDELRRASGL